MFLKSLTLKGFKSFADKTELVFEPGVTVVVGPNGSGKSNLVDAVAWVLGSQGPRSLRGGKMEDVIFAGTASRTALGRAEVELTIDNTAGLLPIEFTEVTITRTLFRTGESEYQLNGVPCRLLDVQELLSDAGVGRQQHVIVGQGQLDTVLNSSPAERRAIIEEAAGILKFRRRKERAERRLTATEGNLLRLGDLLREVRRQLGPLERQADAARRHDAVVDELRAIKLHLAGHQIAGQQARIERLRDERVELANRERGVQQHLRDLDESVIAAEQALAELGADELADELVRAESMRERVRGLTTLIVEKRRNVARELTAAADEGVVETLVADAVSLRTELEALDADATLPGAEVTLPVNVAEDLLRAAEERWRTAEATSARARAKADSLEQQLRAVREAGGAGTLDTLDGVVGALVDHLEVEPGAEAAVAAALGDAMLAVVVERGDAVRTAVERLESDGARALLLVTDPSGGGGAQPALVPPGARPVAELVRSSVPGLTAVLHQLLAHTVLAGVAADDRLIALHLHAGDVLQEPAGGDEPLRVDVGRALVIVEARAEGHHYFFERAVAGPFADAVHRAFDLPCPGFDRREAVGHGKAEIVVAMDADGRLVDIRHAVLEVANDVAHVRRRSVADGIGDVDRRRSGGDGRFHDFAEEIALGAGRIFRREFDVVAVANRTFHAGHGPRDDLFSRHLELEFAMDRAGGEEHMNAGLLGKLKRVPGSVNVLLVATGQAADGAAAHDGGNFADGVKIVGRGDREAGFNDVDAEIDQRLREFQLLSLVHAAAGRLLAVAERGVENLDLAYFAHRRVP